MNHYPETQQTAQPRILTRVQALPGSPATKITIDALILVAIMAFLFSLLLAG